jgi:phage anti-repressor protein
VAALKFCYVDMTGKTDVERLFSQYKIRIEKIQKSYPDLNIIHFTGPLTVPKTSWKTWLKKILGKKSFWEYDDNIKRNEYNQMLVSEYKGKDPILDIAAIESTKPDGSRQSFELDGKTYYSMYPGYTYDGGHLNETGRKKVAEQLLLLLVNL